MCMYVHKYVHTYVSTYAYTYICMKCVHVYRLKIMRKITSRKPLYYDRAYINTYRYDN